MNNKVYEYVTDTILKKLEAGTIPWQKPWVGGVNGPMNLLSKKPYRGINVFLLAFSKFSSPYWLTYNQCKALGGQVRKGEHGEMVVFYKTLEFEKEKTDGSKGTTKVPLLRYYTVFNVEQCDGLEDKLPKVETREIHPIEDAEKVVREMPNRPSITYGSYRACYSPSTDRVSMPDRDTFINAEEFYCTIFHELVHSTGHDSRLKRFGNDATQTMFGSDSYSKEELVAEMGAAFICATLGIEQKIIDNAAAYIDGWRKKISSDPKFVVQAANAAQKSADYILRKNQEEKEVAE